MTTNVQGVTENLLPSIMTLSIFAIIGSGHTQVWNFQNTMCELFQFVLSSLLSDLPMSLMGFAHLRFSVSIFYCAGCGQVLVVRSIYLIQQDTSCVDVI